MITPSAARLSRLFLLLSLVTFCFSSTSHAQTKINPNQINFGAGVQWAGPGATPTIDTAITACGSNPCTVMISSNYTGAESTNLFTTSLGYKVYNGVNNVTIIDLRQNPGTVVSPGLAPIYPIEYGGRMTGALNRASFNYWSASPPDSTAGLQGSNWLSGTLPSAGDQFGVIATINTHDTVTVGASTVQVVGLDAEVNANATSSDAALPTAFGIAAAAHITRVGATQNVTTMGAFKGFGCGNVSAATITNCYVVWALPPGGGSSQAYSIRSDGSIILGDAANFDIYNTAGTPSTFFSTSNGAINFKKDLRGSPAGTPSLGDAGGEWGGLYLFETSSPTGRAGDAVCGAVSATHDLRCSYNNDTASHIVRASDITLTLKKGSGGGNYTTASTTYVVADSTNLCYTVTIPTGWKLGISTSGAIGTATAAVSAQVALTDNAACSTANSGILVETTETTTAAGVLQPWALNWVITGDGNSHNVALQFKTSNAADSATLQNSSATSLPTIKFELLPSN